MDPATKILDPDAKLKPFSFPNGSLKRHHRRLSSTAEAAAVADFLYRECLKNHAASLGGHALDGCGEFMPSPAANPADPTSLKCAACGCHRNFHRRLPELLLLHHRHHSDNGAGGQEGEDDMAGGHDEDNDGRDDEEDGNADGRRPDRRSTSPPPYFSSAPHMLLALSSGLPGAPSPGRAVAAPQAAAVVPRKRFRTKFSPEQKERMHELSERLGWRMQKRDEGLVEEWCKEIGVVKGVFKVWMHNNKHTFSGSARRGQAEIRNGGGGGVGGGGGEAAGDSGGIEVDGNGSAGSGGGGNSPVVNGSSPSS